MQREARLRGLHYNAIALVTNYCIQERGRINETDYTYSIISPPILVAKPNQQKGGGGVISSEYGIYLVYLPIVFPIDQHD